VTATTNTSISGASGKQPGRLSQRATVRALLDDDFIWDAAERLDALAADQLEGSHGGRPRAYPLVCGVIWDALVSVFGSARQVDVELSCVDSDWWDLIRRAAIKRAGILLPVEPMRRHHYRYLRDRYLTSNDTQLAVLTDTFTEHAARLAVEIGLCDPNGSGSLTHPSADRIVAGDGKVLTPRYKTSPNQRGTVDPATGEIRMRRADPDAGLHAVGGGDQAFGTKYVFLSTRGDARNQRIILAVDHSPAKGPGGEAATALAAFDRVLPLLAGTQAVVYDGAFRGTHLHHLITRHGIIPISRVHTAKGGTHRDRYLGEVSVNRAGGPASVQIHLRHGAPCVRQIAVDGTITLHPLERSKILRRQDRDSWRFYAEYRVPTTLGAGTIRLRLDRTTDDEDTGFNREEHLRAIPPADPDHDRLYGRRNDTESGNRLLDDSMLRERAHTVGRRRQLLNLTTWAALRNATAATQHTRHHTNDPPSLAA